MKLRYKSLVARRARSAISDCLVDYFIVWTELFTRVQNMVVNIFDPIMSDVHNMIEVTIDKSVLTEANYIEHEHVQDESMGESACIDSKFIWKQDMADKFNSSLSVNMVDELTKGLGHNLG